MRLTIGFAALALLAGCAMPTLQGRVALSGGRYDEGTPELGEYMAHLRFLAADRIYLLPRACRCR